MACIYYFQGKAYNEADFVQTLRGLSPAEASKHIPDFQTRSAGDIAKGARTLTEDGRQMLHLFQNTADASTLFHESAHILRGMFEDVANETQHPQLLADADYMRTWASDNRGVWDEAAEEKLARGFERYGMDGVAPTSRLERVFQQFSGWLKSIYDRLSGDTGIPGEIPAALRATFDGWFDERIAGGQSVVADGVIPNDMYRFLSETYNPGDTRAMSVDAAHALYRDLHASMEEDAAEKLQQAAYDHRFQKQFIQERQVSGELPKPSEVNRYFATNTERPNVVEGKKVWISTRGTDWRPVGAPGSQPFRDIGDASYTRPKQAPGDGGTWRPQPTAGHELDGWREAVAEKLTGDRNGWPQVEAMVQDYQRSRADLVKAAVNKREAANTLAQTRRAPMKQAPMLQAGEETPLMSGTAQSAQAQAFKPPEVGQQGRLEGIPTAPEFGAQKLTPLQQAEAAAKAKAAAEKPGTLFQSMSDAVAEPTFDPLNHVRKLSEAYAADVAAAGNVPFQINQMFRTQNGTPMYARYAVDGEKAWGNDKFVFMGAKPPPEFGSFRAEGEPARLLDNLASEGGRAEAGRPIGTLDRPGGGKAIVLATEAPTAGQPGLTATIPAEAYHMALSIDPQANFLLMETGTPGKPLVVVMSKAYEPLGYIPSRAPAETVRAERVFGLKDGVLHPDEGKIAPVLTPRPVMPTETPKPAELHAQTDALMDARGRRDVLGDTPQTVRAERDAAKAVQSTDARAELEDALRKGELSQDEYAKAKAQLDAGGVAPTLRQQGEAHALTPEEWKFRGERSARAIDNLDKGLSARPPAPPDRATRTGPTGLGGVDYKTFDTALKDWGARERLTATRTALKRNEFAMPDGAQTNLDRSLDYIQPFHYWMTRNARNWTVRALEHPEFITAYLNYQNYLKQTNKNEPKQYQQSIRTNWDGSPLYVDVMKTINPLERFVNNFQMYNATNDPGINVLNLGAHVGVNPWFPLKWLYAMSIKQRDPQAFRQLIGYDIPTSHIIKYGTAALREASGGKGPFAGIPPGGTYLEGMLFKELGSGDAGENNRIGKALYGLYANNQTNPETGKPATLDEVKRAAFNQQHAADVPNGDKLYPKGTLWDAATQASAIKRSAPEFLTWLGARGITLVDKIDQEVAQARKEWAALPWGGGDSGVLKADLNAFAAKYPWYSALTLSNKDSQDRNALFAGDVLSRIPPGSRTAAYDTAGVKELVNGFYAAKGPLAKSDYLNNLPADQQQKFMQFITATDKQYASPTQAQQASFAAGTKFWDSYNQMDPLARQMLRALPEAQKLNLDSLLNKDSRASYPVSSFDQLAQLAADFSARLTSNKSYQAYQQEFSQHGFSDKTLALESGYFAAGAQGSAERRQYLTANPDLKSYFAWRANFMAQHPDLALASQNKGGLPATTAVASGGATTKGAPTAGLSQASAAAYKDFYAARDARYPNVDIKVLSEQYAALSPGATRTQFLNANPQLKDYFQWHTDYLNKTPAFAAASAEAKHLYQPAATSDPSVIRAAAALAPMARELGSYFSLRAGGGGGSYGGGGRGGGASLSRRGTALLNTVARTYTPQLNTTQLLSALEPFYKLENKGAGGTGGGGGAPFLRNVRYIKPYSRGR